MNSTEEKKILTNIAIFLKRTNLSGEEILAFNEAMGYIGSRIQAVGVAEEALLKDAEKATSD